MNPIKVLLVDDHRVFIDGLHALLLGVEDIQVVGTACDGQTALDALQELYVDIVIMDIDMPGMDGLTATPLIKRDYPDVRILLLSMHNKPTYIRQAVKAGVSGYLLKNSGKNEFVAALHRIAQGRTYLCPDAASVIMDDVLNAEKPQQALLLTNREMEIVRLIVREYSSAQIADALSISIRTVESHRRNIMHKLDIKSTVGLIKYAVSEGWV